MFKDIPWESVWRRLVNLFDQRVTGVQPHPAGSNQTTGQMRLLHQPSSRHTPTVPPQTWHLQGIIETLLNYTAVVISEVD